MKSSGIYRIYIKNKSYVNSSKNIEKQVKKDIKKIKDFLLNKSSSFNSYNNFTWLLNFKTLPQINENNFKMALYIVENNLKISDINYEILKVKDYKDEIETLEDEIFYISKYNSDIEGFNDLTHFNSKLLSAIKRKATIHAENKNFEQLIKTKNSKEFKIHKILREIVNENSTFSPWIYYNLKEYQIELKHHPKWINYCDSMLLKYEDWKKTVDKF